MTMREFERMKRVIFCELVYRKLGVDIKPRDIKWRRVALPEVLQEKPCGAR